MFYRRQLVAAAGNSSLLALASRIVLIKLRTARLVVPLKMTLSCQTETK
jgi:hypothetical protein